MQSRYESVFTTPQAVSDQLLKADTSTPQSVADEYDDYFALAKSYCFQISKIIEQTTRRAFVPYRATKTTYTRQAFKEESLVYSDGIYEFDLEDDLLAIDSITISSVVKTASEYHLADAMGSVNGYPYKQVQLDPSGLSLSTDFDDSIDIVGEWGTHDNVSDTYSNVTTLIANLTDSQTTIDVTDGDGASYNVYDYIRINDELMFITAIATSGDPDVLTVERGVNGFTASAHTLGDQITRWNVVNDVKMLATRMVAYWYNKRNDVGEQVAVVNGAVITAQFSQALAQIASRRQRNRYEVV